MNERTIRQMLEAVAAHDVPPGDWWEAIDGRVTTARQAQQLPPHPRVPQPAGRGFALATAAIVVVLILLPLAVPSVRATVGGFMGQRFGLVLTEPTPSRPQPAPGATAVASAAQLVMWEPLAEVQRRTPFPIRAPAWLPDGLVVRGAVAGPAYRADGVDGPINVRVQYGRADGMTGGLGIEQTATERYQGGYVVPSTKAQSVTVNGRPAVYVRGAWADIHTMMWNDATDAAILSWSQDGFTFMIQAGSLGLSRDDLIRIAESLR